MSKYRAAWLPIPLPDGEPDPANDVAVEWMLAQSSDLGINFVCYSPVFNVLDAPGSSELFAQVVISAGVDYFKQRPAEPENHSVLAFVDSQATLDLASEWAEGGALVAVPVAKFDLSTWAREHDATNLLG